MSNFKDNIPDVRIEQIGDGIGDGLICLEQDNCGETESVAIHPIHLRYMAEKFGLIPTSDPEGAKMIAQLQRRMRLLQERIEHLHDWLGKQIERGHVNLEHEATYSQATVDLVGEFCAELERQG